MQGAALELAGPPKLELRAEWGQPFQMDLPEGLFAPGSHSGRITYALQGGEFVGITVDPQTGAVAATPDFWDHFPSEYSLEIVGTDELGASQTVGINLWPWPRSIFPSSEATAILGTRDADWLWTSRGDDVVYGGAGSDTYTFAPGDGHDVIEESHPLPTLDQDAVSFQDPLTPADVRVRREGADLVLTYGAGDSVSVTHWFDSAANRIEAVRFADGTVWDEARLQALAEGQPETVVGTSAADALIGTDGNDLLLGGAGDDALSGGTGDDTYRYRLGDGSDILMDSGGDDTLELVDIHPGEVILGTSLAGDVKLFIRTTGDSISLERNQNGGTETRLEHIVFADGTTWRGGPAEQVPIERQVQALVEGMAAFTAPVDASTMPGFRDDYARLAPALAVSAM